MHLPKTEPNLYNKDFFAWTQTQAVWLSRHHGEKRSPCYKFPEDGLRRIDNLWLSLKAYCRLTHPTLIYKILLSPQVREIPFPRECPYRLTDIWDGQFYPGEPSELI